MSNKKMPKIKINIIAEIIDLRFYIILLFVYVFMLLINKLYGS